MDNNYNYPYIKMKLLYNDMYNRGFPKVDKEPIMYTEDEVKN